MEQKTGRPPRQGKVDKMTLRLDKETGDFIREMADTEDRTLSATVQRMIEAFRKKDEQESNVLLAVAQ